MTSFSQLRIASLFLVGVVVAGVVGYRVLEDYSWLDSLYMTVITPTTVGFQEIRPLSPTGRVFTIAPRWTRSGCAKWKRYLVLHGDASDQKVLLAAGVTQAKGLLAALPTDAGHDVGLAVPGGA